ncbi:MAG: DNA topoisomerase VI subunit B, partial [bacterium]
ATAESMSRQQREISVSEFFLKNRHLLGFDSPRKALLTAVKEAVDNSLDACEEAGLLPELSVEITQTGEKRFRMEVTDNGPGVMRQQVPRIFAKLLYGSKFHRLRMSRGQQGIGISAAGMYGQLTTGAATRILSRIARGKTAHHIEVQIDTRKNAPTILKDVELDWRPSFPRAGAEGVPVVMEPSPHGTSVSIEMEAQYVRGRLSVDEFLRQCLVANPHLQLHYRINLLNKDVDSGGQAVTPLVEGQWISWPRLAAALPVAPVEIKPHPHGVELGMLMQMLRDTESRTLRAALSEDFSRVSSQTALDICTRAGLDPKAKPQRIANREIETLFKAIGETKLMRPPTDCLSPIGEALIIGGLAKEIEAEFCTAVTRDPTVYRGNPFQVEVGLAYAKAGANEGVSADEQVRVLRYANRVPLLYMGGACAINKAITGVNWKNYGLAQPRGALPVGPAVIMVHIASVWVPFTSESKEAIAHYPEIIREIAFCVQECGRRLAVHLSRRNRENEAERKRSYIDKYIPHLALGLKGILDLPDRDEDRVVKTLRTMLERTHLEA